MPVCQFCSAKEGRTIYLEPHTGHYSSGKPYPAWICPICRGVWAR